MMRLEEPTSLDPSAIAKMQEENEKIVKIVEVLVSNRPGNIFHDHSRRTAFRWKSIQP